MIDSTAMMGNLKDFQRTTVDYVFKRMYLDKNPALRFLIADEVGLGKTLAARGVVARAIEKMQQEGEIKRIDVIYICSNAAIARQNINRLNVTGEKNTALASRLTLLPLHLPELENRKLNFVSFTPGTTFDLKSSTGVAQERALIYRMMRASWPFDSLGFKKMLRCDVYEENWDYYCHEKELKYNRKLAREFRESILADSEFTEKIRECSRKFSWLQGEPNASLNRHRNRIIAQLRLKLAWKCVSKLEPDLVILDEFQRFRNILSGDSDASMLARRLMKYVDPESGTHARVLLLSATPYKMYTLSDEEEDHYCDFMETLKFLFEDTAKVEAVKRELEEYRLALFDHEVYDPDRVKKLQRSLRRRLMKVMVRTERVGFTRNLNAMMSEDQIVSKIQVYDILQASGVDSVASAVDARNIIEYWKSAPYLLNFMKKYKLKTKLNKLLEARNRQVTKAVRENISHMLSEESVSNFEPLEPGNPRLRSLISRTVGNHQWTLLWVPASLPYYAPSSVFAEVPQVTKTLVFSSWSVVPDVISSICSYEAERRMVRSSDSIVEYKELHNKISQFLRFQMKDEQPTGMSTLLMHYPSPALAELIDPLEIAIDRLEEGIPCVADVFLRAREKLSHCIGKLKSFEDESSLPDRSWHWAALAKLDSFSPNIRKWCNVKNRGWKEVGTGSQREGEAFPEHVEHFASAIEDSYRLGEMPGDMLDILTELALGSPAICAARALRRIAPSLAYDDPVLLSAAAGVANGFRSLYNNPDSQLLLRHLGKEDHPLWRCALWYAIHGNLQAVLDEYAHVLKESLGLFDHTDEEVVQQVSKSMQEALSMRVSSVAVDEFDYDKQNRYITKNTFRMRCRFALRFSDIKDDTESVLIRAGTVREAFNSPFKPFVLASTSIGQEGLDFHTYCHSVWHWNLPSNPVDLEQREGRIHRYKGHAVRKNVASRFGAEAIKQCRSVTSADPWTLLFKLAVRHRPKELNDLYPYWIFEDTDKPFKIERIVPMLPFSKEESKLVRLKKSLALYRLAFGQPRQEDLLEFLLENSEEDMDSFRISLQP